MLAGSMPKRTTSARLVDTATKCRAIAASSRSAPSVQARAVAALVIVSRVVNVFDETMKRVAAEHRVDAPAKVALLGQREQEAQRLVGDAVLRVVEIEPGRLGREPLAAARILGEQRSQVHAANASVMGGELLPRRELGQRT